MDSFKPSVGTSFKGGKPQLKVGLFNNGTLEKAELIPLDKGVPKIKFMFNPTELSFDGQVNISHPPGSSDKTDGKPKTNFSHIKAFNVTINKIIFDTYENGDNVVEKYIEPFLAAIKFVDSKEENSPYSLKGINQSINKAVNNEMSSVINKLPSSIQKGITKVFGGEAFTGSRVPLYRFVWGEQIYLRCCFVEQLKYKLTMFLPDGTPVRACIDSLVLKEAEPIKPNGDILTTVTDRIKDSLEARMNIKGSLKF